MRVLLTNDDGIRAEGLRAMYRALREAGHTVHVVAPMHEQSGVGHSLTFFDPLRAHKIEEPDFEGLGLYGTPTDCVKLALALEEAFGVGIADEDLPNIKTVNDILDYIQSKKQ